MTYTVNKCVSSLCGSRYLARTLTITNFNNCSSRSISPRTSKIKICTTSKCITSKI